MWLRGCWLVGRLRAGRLARPRVPVGVEGHAVGQAPAVASGGVRACAEQSQAATVSVQVLVGTGGRVHAGLVRPWVDGEDGLAHPPGGPSRGSSVQPQRLHPQLRVVLPIVPTKAWGRGRGAGSGLPASAGGE